MSKNYQEYTEAFFQNLAKQEVELAINTLFQTNPWTSRMIDQVRHISSQLIQLQAMAGNYIDYQVLVDKVFSGIYAAQFCLAIYDRQSCQYFQLGVRRTSIVGKVYYYL
ncbi:MAG: hypothetical protein AAFS12_05840 [Cyanobacteria bacterium J06632_19]